MHLEKKHWLIIIALVLAVYVILPQVGDFRHGLSLARQADTGWLIKAVLASLATYLAAAGTYCWLAFKRLHYGRTVLVELASTFANRLLPAGIGNLGVNYRYLRFQKHTPAQATAVVAVNNLLGFVGHMLIFALLLAVAGNRLPALRFKLQTGSLLTIVAGVIIAIIFLLAHPRLKRRLGVGLIHAIKQIKNYRRRQARLLLALSTSLAMTLLNILCFYFCLQALHIQLSFITALVVFSFGVLVASATPTPGGLGGVEAALVAGLIAFKVEQSQALAAVIIYRLIYYWLGLLLGALSWPVVRRRGYLA